MSFKKSKHTDKHRTHKAIKSQIQEGCYVEPFFSKEACVEIEEQINDVVEKGNKGKYLPYTVDRAALRNKYFFGGGYTYGVGKGEEKVYPKGCIDKIPSWIRQKIIVPLERQGVVKENWINSAVINDYQPGGFIVSHIDPKHIFDRPIFSVSFFSDSALSFGVKFNFHPFSVSEPLHRVPIKRGELFAMHGYAADEVTHCVRPEDVKRRRAVIILRHIRDNAPVMPIAELELKKKQQDEDKKTGKTNKRKKNPKKSKKKRKEKKSAKAKKKSKKRPSWLKSSKSSKKKKRYVSSSSSSSSSSSDSDSSSSSASSIEEVSSSSESSSSSPSESLEEVQNRDPPVLVSTFDRSKRERPTTTVKRSREELQQIDDTTTTEGEVDTNATKLEEVLSKTKMQADMETQTQEQADARHFLENQLPDANEVFDEVREVEDEEPPPKKLRRLNVKPTLQRYTIRGRERRTPQPQLQPQLQPQQTQTQTHIPQEVEQMEAEEEEEQDEEGPMEGDEFDDQYEEQEQQQQQHEDQDAGEVANFEEAGQLSAQQRLIQRQQRFAQPAPAIQQQLQQQHQQQHQQQMGIQQQQQQYFEQENEEMVDHDNVVDDHFVQVKQSKPNNTLKSIHMAHLRKAHKTNNKSRSTNQPDDDQHHDIDEDDDTLHTLQYADNTTTTTHCNNHHTLTSPHPSHAHMDTNNHNTSHTIRFAGESQSFSVHNEQQQLQPIIQPTHNIVKNFKVTTKNTTINTNNSSFDPSQDAHEHALPPRISHNSHHTQQHHQKPQKPQNQQKQQQQQKHQQQQYQQQQLTKRVHFGADNDHTPSLPQRNQQAAKKFTVRGIANNNASSSWPKKLTTNKNNNGGNRFQVRGLASKQKQSTTENFIVTKAGTGKRDITATTPESEPAQMRNFTVVRSTQPPQNFAVRKFERKPFQVTRNIVVD